MDESAFRDIKMYLHNRKGIKKIFKFGLVREKGSIVISKHSCEEPKLFHLLRKLVDVHIEFSYTTMVIVPAVQDLPIQCKLQNFVNKSSPMGKCCLIGFGSNSASSIENNGTKYGIHLAPILLETTDPLFVLQPCDQTYYAILLYTQLDKHGSPIPNTLSEYECVSSDQSWKLLHYKQGEPAKYMDKKRREKRLRKHSNEITSVFDGDYTPAQNLLFSILSREKPLEGIPEDASTDTESSEQQKN